MNFSKLNQQELIKPRKSNLTQIVIVVPIQVCEYSYKIEPCLVQRCQIHDEVPSTILI